MTKKKSRPKKEQTKEKQEGFRIEEKMVFGIFVAIILIIGLIIAAGKYIYRHPSEDEPFQIQEKIKYNGYSFVKINNVWHTTLAINGLPYEMSFYYSPKEVLDIQSRDNVANYLLSNVYTIMITVDPDLPPKSVIAGTEISKVASRVRPIKIKAGVSKEVAGKETGVITCKDVVPQQINVVSIRQGNKTKIAIENGCVIIQGPTSDELIRAADRLALEMVKVIATKRPIRNPG